MTPARGGPIAQATGVEFGYGSLAALDGVDVTLVAGEVVALVGPSGCGKSTLLRVIAGLETPQAGRVRLETTAHRVGLRYMFQDYDAFPWLTVGENVATGSGVAPHPPPGVVQQLLERVGLWTSADQFPAELSGGMRKRLGLARALIREPELLLLDEPFASLDFKTRLDMYALLEELTRALDISVLLVTHDLNEAVLLSDRVLVASPRPMSIRADVPVKLRRPRAVAMIEEPEFRGVLRRLYLELGYLERADRVHAIEDDQIQLRTASTLTDELVNAVSLDADAVFRQVGDLLLRVERVRMGGRSSAMAGLCVLLWRAAADPECRARVTPLVDRIASAAIRSLGDPSVAQPEWAVVMLGVLASRWLGTAPEDVELGRTIRHVVHHFAAERGVGTPQIQAAAKTLLDQWNAEFPHGLVSVAEAGRQSWPSIEHLGGVTDAEIADRVSAIAQRLPRDVTADDYAWYRLHLERQGEWKRLGEMALLLR